MEKDNKTVVYISMEYAIDQSLKIYSGGLGFLAGSHLRAAYQLNKNLIGVGLLYKHGYYDQIREPEGQMQPAFIKKEYSYLEDTGINFTVYIHDAPVKVKAFLLSPSVFATAPLYLLTTDLPENDYLSKTICNRLYDHNTAAKIAQYMVLGIGATKLMEALNIHPTTYHLNEGHGLPVLFQLLSKFKNIDEVRSKVCFTTHTPEKAGNDEINLSLLQEMSFFGDVSPEEVLKYAHVENNTLNFTLTALKMSRKANGVSKLHKDVSNILWGDKKGKTEITGITNAQDEEYWKDKVLKKCQEENNDEQLWVRKLELKKELFSEVANQTGKLFDPKILTMVWARRFAGYKRADLLLKDFERFLQLVSRKDFPLQIIWAGKPYPEDATGVHLFNEILNKTRRIKNCAVLIGYELQLSAMLKRGADVWLNTPRFPKEASGTSGMTAAMNGAINFSIPDGWIPEFARHGENAFVIPSKQYVSLEVQDSQDHQHMMHLLESMILPMYYNNRKKWIEIMKTSMKEITPLFDAKRMVKEYYDTMYH